MHIIDIIIVITYPVLCILISLYKSKAIKTLKEYTIGNGYFPTVVIISTIFATDIDALNTMGNIEKIYALGIFYVVPRLLSPLCWIIMAKVYSKNIAQFHGCISLSDIMQQLYGTTGRWITNVSSVIISLGFIAVQATALGYISNYFFDIPRSYGIVVGAGIIALYSAFGGIRMVAITDVFQLVIFIIAIPLACAFAYRDVGGYHGIVNTLPNEMLRLEINRDNIGLFLSLIFYALIPCTAGCYIQRFLACGNARQLDISLKIICAISIPFTIVICLIGLIIKAKAPNIDPNTAFIYFISHYLIVGVKGLTIAGLLAVSMSTADSYLNYTSVLCTHDIVRKLIVLTEKQALLIAKLFTIIVTVVSVYLSLYRNSIIEMIWLVYNFWGPVIMVPLIVGFLGFKTNSNSFIISTIIAVLFTSVSGYLVGNLSTISLMCGMIGSAIGLFGMHYWQVHQGVLNFNTQPTKHTHTINK